MRISIRSTFAAVLAVSMVGVTAAQQRPERPGGGGGGGFFGGGGLTSLIRSKTVRDDIKISEDQGKKLLAWGKEEAPKLREMMQAKMKDIPREQFREKIGEVMKEVNAETEKQLGTILNPDQLKRLKQIEVQLQGTRAITSPSVAEALKVTDEQREKIQNVSRDSFTAMNELRKEFGIRGFGRPGQGNGLDEGKQKQYDEKLAEIRKQIQEKSLAVLSADQQKQFKDLTGEPIDVSKVREETQGQRRPRDGQRPGGDRPGGERPAPKGDAPPRNKI